ncbi:hypothetical protein ACFOUV_07655 [Oceanobacillus longus]|uniref:Uncharacterized protein n=1 Tax=Oceanobacillus longus TaxID=930120 RepID=A0ABV8GVQ5_9BACI
MMRSLQQDKKKKGSAWDWIMDILLFIPELIIIPFRLLFRGVAALFKYWN